MSKQKGDESAFGVAAGSAIPVWAVFWKGELHCCRATEREATAVGFQFADQSKIKIVVGTFSPNTGDEARRQNNKSP